MFPIFTAVYALCRQTVPEKKKYGVCVVPNERLFFLFNSRPAHGPTRIAMLEVDTCEAPFLKHKSYLDTGILVCFDEDVLIRAISCGHRWPLEPALCEKIRTKVNFHGMLPGKYEKIILGPF